MTEENYCMYCGSKLESNSRLCTNCGSSLLSPPTYSDEPQSSKSSSSTTIPLSSAASSTPSSSTQQALKRLKRQVEKTSPWGAALISFILPGAGQMYAGETERGIVCLIISISFVILAQLSGIGVTLFLIFLIICSYDAYKLAERHNEELMQSI